MITMRELKKVYQKPGHPPVRAIDGVSLKIEAGEFVAILGPSGSGKSTLMGIIGLLDRPDSGTYKLNGKDVFTLGDNELARLRSQTIGFVFQAYHLLPRTTAIENVQLALLYSNCKDYKARSKSALEEVGLSDRIHHFANELSGGQQQRVAIARATVNDPAIILADEPTGNLDSQARDEILQLFDQQNRKGTTIVLITHDAQVAQRAYRIIRISNGAIASDTVTREVHCEY